MVSAVSSANVSSARWVTNETVWLPSIASSDDVNDLHRFASRVLPLYQAIAMATNPQFNLDLPTIDSVNLVTEDARLSSWHTGLLAAVMKGNGKSPRKVTSSETRDTPGSIQCYERAVLTSVATTVVTPECDVFCARLAV